MRKDWFQNELNKYSRIEGYKKPEKYSNVLKLDSNENYAVSQEFLQEIVNEVQEKIDVRGYPLGGTEKMVQAISKHIRMPEEMIGVGNGSDQIIDLFLSNFASRKTKILTSDPTFGFFEERCKQYCIPTIKIPYEANMTLNLDKFLLNSKKADILYLDTPNNPTGFQFKRKSLEKLIREFNGLIIIDEAYVEFSDYSIIEMTKKFDNLIVLRTLSKSFGLAGLRIGYFVANSRIADTFSRVLQYPYPMSTFAIEIGILALRHSKYFIDIASLVKKERTRIIDNLRQMKIFEVFDSKANFILFATGGSGQRIQKALIEQGISIKNLGKIGQHEGCLRVTVGSQDMNSKFLTAMRDLLN
jgi:histidinol-phosphate aminotransferase